MSLISRISHCAGFPSFPNASEYNCLEHTIPYITGASNFEDGRIIINRWTDSPTTHATIDDLLLTCKGSGVGKMVWCNIENAHIARQIMALRCIDGLYKNYLEIPLPPLEEQLNIVHTIEKLYNYIEKSLN